MSGQCVPSPQPAQPGPPETRQVTEMTWSMKRWGTAAAALALLSLAGCAGGSGTTDSGSSAGVAKPMPATGAPFSGKDEARSSAGTAGQPDGTAGQPASTVIQTRQVISTGDVEIEAKNLGKARDELDRLLGRYGGYVSDEQTTNDKHGETSRSVLKIRVPSQYFDQLMSSFRDFSTVLHTDRQAVDVTTEVIDVQARIRTAEMSLQRLRSFLGKAHNVDSIIRLESEISSREADLSSMLQQQKYLADQTSLATVTVTMTRPSTTPEPPKPLQHAGFLTGLSNGWDALLGALVVAATVVGALTPFAVLVALVGVPVWLWVRSRERRRTPAAPPAAPPAA